MSTINAYSPAYGLPEAAAPKGRNLFLRFFDRVIESRMRSAAETIRRHSHLVPRELEDQAGWKLTSRSEDSLPFIR